MSFASFTEEQDSIALLQRSLERGRLGHAYLFHGADLDELEAVARTLAKTVNCTQPKARGQARSAAADSGLPLDSCDACDSCRRIDSFNHPDVFWLRPESKSRVIRIEQIRKHERLKFEAAAHPVAARDVSRTQLRWNRIIEEVGSENEQNRVNECRFPYPGPTGNNEHAVGQRLL